MFLKSRPFDASANTNTTMYSPLSPDIIFENLLENFDIENRESIKISKTYWKMSYSVQKKYESIALTEEVNLSIEIQDTGKDLNAIVLKRKSGSASLFY